MTSKTMHFVTALVTLLSVAYALPAMADQDDRPQLFGRAGARIRKEDQSNVLDRRTAVPLQLPIRNNRLTYYLPKQWGDLTVTYTGLVATNNGQVGFARIGIDKAITFALVTLPDPNLKFEVDFRKARGLVTDTTNAEFDFTDHSILSQINSEKQDQTAAIVADVAASAINVAKKIGAFGLGGAPQPIDVTVHRLVNFDNPKDTTDGPKGYENGSYFDVDECTCTDPKQTTDPYTSEDTPAYWPGSMSQTAADSFKSANWNSFVPRLRIWIDKRIPHTNIWDNAQLANNDPDGLRTNYLQSVVVRQPEVVKLLVTEHFGKGALDRSDTPIYESAMQLAQTGDIVTINLRRHGFSHTSVKLSLTSAGAVSSINETSTSPLKTITDAIKTITGAL